MKLPLASGFSLLAKNESPNASGKLPVASDQKQT
jgi:hypothetical protein